MGDSAPEAVEVGVVLGLGEASVSAEDEGGGREK